MSAEITNYSCAAGKVEWAIAQSDWREVKRVSGKRIYVWADKEWV